MRTSKEWWERMKADPVAQLRWLRDQYHGEAAAAIRMQKFVDKFGCDAKFNERKTVEEIARQEAEHAEWIGQLLTDRGVEPHLLMKTERYWEATLKGITSWDTGCAVAAHAEKMRLDRIRVIANDPESPADIRDVFAKILPQEEFHERAFRAFTSEAALFTTLGNHMEGAEALGLVA